MQWYVVVGGVGDDGIAAVVSSGWRCGSGVASGTFRSDASASEAPA